MIDEKHLLVPCFAKFKSGGILFSEIMPNFCRYHATSIYKCINSIDKMKLNLYPHVRKSTTHLTLMFIVPSFSEDSPNIFMLCTVIRMFWKSLVKMQEHKKTKIRLQKQIEPIVLGLARLHLYLSSSFVPGPYFCSMAAKEKSTITVL